MHIAQAQRALLLRIYNTYQIKRSVLHWVVMVCNTSRNSSKNYNKGIHISLKQFLEMPRYLRISITAMKKQQETQVCGYRGKVSKPQRFYKRMHISYGVFCIFKNKTSNCKLQN